MMILKSMDIWARHSWTQLMYPRGGQGLVVGVGQWRSGGGWAAVREGVPPRWASELAGVAGRAKGTSCYAGR